MNILVISASEAMCGWIVEVLRVAGIIKEDEVPPNASNWAQVLKFYIEMKLVVLVIDIDEEPDYLTAVQEAAFNFGCYIIVVSKSMPCEEMVRELNQVGAAKIIQLPHEKAALAAEFLGFNTEFWTS